VSAPGAARRGAARRGAARRGAARRAEREAEDLAPGLERLFDRVPVEDSYRVEGIEGEVPGWVRGTYYVNGPARFARGDVAYRHWLDGDGMVCALAFDDDGVRFTNRFVASEKLVEEEAAGRALYRTFGTAFAGDRLVRGVALASPVNVGVYPWAGRLLAFGEQGLPWELDRETLATLGPFDFGRRLNPVSPFAAHAAIDKRSGELLNFGISFSAHRPHLNLYRFGADGELVYRRRLPLDAPRSVHDFTLSERYAIFYLSPYVLDMGRLMEGGATLLECLDWRPELGSVLLVASRETGDEVARLPIGEKYSLHLANAYEEDGADGGERLVVDVLELEEPVYGDYREMPDLFVDVEPGQPVRRVVDLARGELAGERRIDYRRACDFPAVAAERVSRPYDELWLLGIGATGRRGRKFFDELVHGRWSTGEAETWRAPAGRYLGGEPVHVSHPDDPDRGVVLCQELDPAERRAAFLLFDAHAVARGPRARIPLRHPIPPLFHACWEPAEAG